jgi:hypothetical protein
MRRTIVLGAAGVLLLAVGVIAANTHIAHGIIPVTAYEADVNKDARVNSGDLGLVASKFGQPVPTATPTAAPYDQFALATDSGIAQTPAAQGYEVISANWFPHRYILARRSNQPVVPLEIAILVQPVDAVAQLNQLGMQGWRYKVSFTATNSGSFVMQREIASTGPAHEYATIGLNEAELNARGAAGWVVVDVIYEGGTIVLERPVP